ncbi:MAG TPA: BrxA/BrxB family bacilliredoxin, partial [Bacillales bacterium]|nr:BrxA/BrxB family bacilliredoxin [Bacillales bacterium]
MVNAYEEYMKEIVTPMRKELTDAGFEELASPEEVDVFMENADGTSLVFV